MRLAVVTNDYPPKPGGIQQYLANLVGAWEGSVRVLAPHDGPAAETQRGEDVVRRHPPNPGPPRNFLWPTRSVGDWVEEELYGFGPDYVLFGAPHPLTGLIAQVRHALSVPVGVLAHGAEVTIPAAVPGLSSVLGRLLAQADVRFAVSRFTAARVERLAGGPCTVVGAGVDLDNFQPSHTGRTGPLVIGCVSRFVPRKQQDLVLRAAERLDQNGVACEVVFVGKGRLEARLRKLAAEVTVPVTFHVDVPWKQLPELYASFDVFCMPCRSRWGGLEVEGLGLVFLEAAASGLPVLVGDSGGAPETIIPGATGFVVRSVDDIVEAVSTLVADDVMLAEMRSAARVFAESEFSWKRVVERFVDGFESVGGAQRDLDT